jgi:hypothetical protein
MKKSGAVLLALLLVSGCDDKGDEFVGHWNATGGDLKWEITRSGDVYTAHIDGFGWGAHGTTYTAAVKDGVLLIERPNMPAIKLLFDKHSGHLIFGGEDFIKGG